MKIFYLIVGMLVLSLATAADARRPELHLQLHGGYLGYFDSDVDDLNGPLLGLHVGYQAKKNVAFGFGLERMSGEEDDLTLTQTRVYAHLEYHSRTSLNPHFYAGIGPALTFVEWEYDNASFLDDDEVTVGGDIKGGGFFPVGESLAITAEARLTFLFVDLPGDESNLTNLTGLLGLRWVTSF